MKIKNIIDEDFTNYKKPNMFIAFPYCTFKCDKECGKPVCQNSELANAPDININIKEIVQRYINNPITTAIVMGGLEPFDSWDDLWRLIVEFRHFTTDDIVIYTGYTEEEVYNMRFITSNLRQFPNIIIKFGRFNPKYPPKYNELLGIELATGNQCARRVSRDNR